MKSLPNLLTISRLLMLPVIIGLLFVPESWAAWTCLGLYILGAITDFFDGWLARRMNVASAFGKLFDPISDKIYVASMLVALVEFDRLPGLWMLTAIIILCREFLVSGLREFLAPRNITLHVTPLAKWKTTIQMIAVGILVIGPFIPYGLIAGQVLMLVAALMTVVTGWNYLTTALKYIR